MKKNANVSMIDKINSNETKKGTNKKATVTLQEQKRIQEFHSKYIELDNKLNNFTFKIETINELAKIRKNMSRLSSKIDKSKEQMSKANETLVKANAKLLKTKGAKTKEGASKTILNQVDRINKKRNEFKDLTKEFMKLKRQSDAICRRNNGIEFALEIKNEMLSIRKELGYAVDSVAIKGQKTATKGQARVFNEKIANGTI